MGQRLSQDFINEILIKADIKEEISKRMSIKKAGHEYHGLCPFHNEKTASFTVSPKKRFFYCFGCGASGNVISFVMQFDKSDFRSATISIAESLSIPVPLQTQEETKQYEKNQITKQLLDQVSIYYQTQLDNYPTIKQYLFDRGLSASTIKKFAIGFSPKNQPEWHKILPNFNKASKHLEEAGLTYTNDNQQQKTRFKGRIIFPIKNVSGDVIAFGARKVNDTDHGPKYLNSPETNLFKKSFELYGLCEVKKHNLDQLLVVEGYMDVISLAEHGINNAVATSGTAVNSQHIKTLIKHSQNITFCFDGDNAGKRAAWKALVQILPIMDSGIEAFFMFLPEKEDPDSILKQGGKESFLKHLQNKKSATDFFFNNLLPNSITQKNDIASKSKATKLALEIIESIPNGVFKHLMLEQVNKRLSIDIAPATPVTPSPTKKFNTNDHLSKIISMLIQKPSIAGQLIIPKLIYKLTNNKTKWLTSLLETIQAENISNSAVLMQKWQNHEAYSWLVELMMLKHLISPEDFLTDAQGRLNILNMQLIQDKINVIIREAKCGELQKQQKQALNELILLKNKLNATNSTWDI